MKSTNNILQNQHCEKIERNASFLLSLQKAIRESLDESTTPPKSLEGVSCNYQMVTNAGNSNIPFRFSARHILPLMKATGSTAILKYFAREMGYVITKLPEAKESEDNIFILHLRMNKQISNLILYLQSAFIEEKIDVNYFRKLDNLAFQIIEIIQNFRASIELMRKKYESK